MDGGSKFLDTTGFPRRKDKTIKVKHMRTAISLTLEDAEDALYYDELILAMVKLVGLCKSGSDSFNIFE